MKWYISKFRICFFVTGCSFLSCLIALGAEEESFIVLKEQITTFPHINSEHQVDMEGLTRLRMESDRFRNPALTSETQSFLWWSLQLILLNHYEDLYCREHEFTTPAIQVNKTIIRNDVPVSPAEWQPDSQESSECQKKCERYNYGIQKLSSLLLFGLNLSATYVPATFRNDTLYSLIMICVDAPELQQKCLSELGISEPDSVESFLDLKYQIHAFPGVDIPIQAETCGELQEMVINFRGFERNENIQHTLWWGLNLMLLNRYSTLEADNSEITPFRISLLVALDAKALEESVNFRNNILVPLLSVCLESSELRELCTNKFRIHDTENKEP